MPAKKRWRKHLCRQWKKANYHYLAYQKKGKPHDLHKFRIAGKQLLAMGELLAKCSSRTNWQELLHPLAKLNKQAGRQRNRYQTSRLLNCQHSTDSQQNRKKLKKYYSRWRKISLAKMVKQLRPPSAKCLRRFYWESWQQLQVIFSDLNKQDQWHAARTLIKTLLFCYPLVAAKDRRKIRLKGPFLHQLEQALGDWHDLYLASLKGRKKSLDTRTRDDLANRLSLQAHFCQELASEFLAGGMWVKAPQTL